MICGLLTVPLIPLWDQEDTKASLGYESSRKLAPLPMSLLPCSFWKRSKLLVWFYTKLECTIQSAFWASFCFHGAEYAVSVLCELADRPTQKCCSHTCKLNPWTLAFCVFFRTSWASLAVFKTLASRKRKMQPTTRVFLTIIRQEAEQKVSVSTPVPWVDICSSVTLSRQQVLQWAAM